MLPVRLRWFARAAVLAGAAVVLHAGLPREGEFTTERPALYETWEEAEEAARSQEVFWNKRAPAPPDGEAAQVFVIPLQGPVSPPMLYILKRGLKEAIDTGVGTVVLDIDTPGGRLDVTLEIMEALDRFEGHSIAFVNNEALSAGAFISLMADDIVFAPKAVIGAAEVVQGGGQDVPESMKRKIESYLGAKVRSLTQDYRYRGDVLRAMMDPDFVLEIEGETLKEEGELLSLTAREAMELYGEPPQPLLGSAIFAEVKAMLKSKFGEDGWTEKAFEVTWSEELAQYLDAIAPILTGIGLLLLFIEFKTPGFGFIGGAGIALLIGVFLSGYVAGLAGHETVLIAASLLIVGLGLVALELFVFPGTIVFALAGGVAVLLGIVVGTADFWPAPDGEGIAFEAGPLLEAARDLVISLALAVAAFLVLLQFLPKAPYLNRMILKASVAGTSGGGVAAVEAPLPGETGLPAAGSTGVAITSLRPSGQVEVNGRRYEAVTALEEIHPGDAVRVAGTRQFALLVEKVES